MVAESEEFMTAERGQSNSVRCWELKSRNTSMKQKELTENGMRSTFSDVLPLAKPHFLKLLNRTTNWGPRIQRSEQLGSILIQTIAQCDRKKKKPESKYRDPSRLKSTADLGVQSYW